MTVPPNIGRRNPRLPQTRQVHHGHVFHIAGSPTVAESPQGLVSLPDGAIVVDDTGRIAYCGPHAELPETFSTRRPVPHRASWRIGRG